MGEGKEGAGQEEGLLSHGERHPGSLVFNLFSLPVSISGTQGAELNASSSASPLPALGHPGTREEPRGERRKRGAAWRVRVGSAAARGTGRRSLSRA